MQHDVVPEEVKAGNAAIVCKHIEHKDNAKDHELRVFLLMKNGFHFDFDHFDSFCGYVACEIAEVYLN